MALSRLLKHRLMSLYYTDFHIFLSIENRPKVVGFVVVKRGARAYGSLTMDILWYVRTERKGSGSSEAVKSRNSHSIPVGRTVFVSP